MLQFGDTSSITGTECEYRWGDMYQFLQEEQYQTESIDGIWLFENIKWFALHKVAARLELFPCAEIIEWLIPQIDAKRRVINTIVGVPIASFEPGTMSKYYKFPNPEIILSNDWMQSIQLNYVTFLKKYWLPDKHFRQIDSGIYNNKSLRQAYRMTVALLFHLHGEADATHFKIEWCPLLYYVTIHGARFNWCDILSKNMEEAVLRVQDGAFKKEANFFMSSYLVDVVCASNQFPGMGWDWVPDKTPINVCCKVLWSQKYISSYNQICKEFIRPLYTMLHGTPAKCMSDNGIVTMTQLGDWFLTPDGTYLCIYGVSRAPNILPRYVTDYMVLKEIAYQAFINGIGSLLNICKKASWPPLPVIVGVYTFAKVKDAIELTQDLEKYQFGQARYRRNGRKGKVANHCAFVKYHWPYAHDLCMEEEIYRQVETLEDLAKKMGKGKGVEVVPCRKEAIEL